MCGIWGWWNRNGCPAPDEMTIRQAADIMRKRGPDDFGFYRSPSGFAMGFRRLSIIDLTTGHQPVSNEDGSVQVTLNGEIYNFQSVRERLIGLGHVFRTFSDTEVIVHGYEQWGEAVVDRLCGMFAIAIWDENHRRLLLIRDRLGIKPLYYFIKNDIFGYASDPRALMTFPGICHSLDKDALSLYLYYGYVPAPWTIYKDIKKLRPGHLCVVSDNSEYISRYWNISFEPIKQEKKIYQQRFSELFGEVVGEHLISDVPLGAFLSGGMDSTSVVQAASEKNGKQILTFNMAFDDPEANESFYARQAADILNSDHHEMSMAYDPAAHIVEALSQFPEPFGDSAAVPNYLLSGMIRRLCTVALSGDGGDEVFAGYSLRKVQALAYIRKLPYALRKSMADIPKIGQLAALSLYDTATIYADSRSHFELCQIEQIISPDDNPLRAIESHIQLMRDELHQADIKGMINPFLFLDQSFGLPDQMLTKTDVTSMAQSIEIRVPFLDHRIVEFAANLPEDMKQKGFGNKRTKKIIRSYLSQKFPDSFIHRPKKGFGMPLKGTLLIRMKQEMNLDNNNFFSNLPNIILTEPLRNLLKTQRLNTNALWNLYALSVWWKQVGKNHILKES